MRCLLVLIWTLLISGVIHSQEITGKWLIHEGRDGAELVVTLLSDGSGQAELSLVRRMLAVSYGEGSQFWGTFRTTGGYYFLVKGSKTVEVSVSRKDSTFSIKLHGKPANSVSAWLDESYSTRDLSDYGDYKKQVVAQWKGDFPTNEDVKKGKLMMEHYFTDFYDDAFEVLLEGEYHLVEHTESTIVLKKIPLDLSITWKRLNE